MILRDLAFKNRYGPGHFALIHASSRAEWRDHADWSSPVLARRQPPINAIAMIASENPHTLHPHADLIR